MFEYHPNVQLPKITDIINFSDFPPNMMRIFTYAWITFLGGWFFAIIIGIFGAALYMKTKNTVATIGFFIIMTSIFGSLLYVNPPGAIPSAATFVYFVGVFAAFVIGFMLYQLFISKRE